MQGGGRVKAHRRPDPVGDERVDGHALVDLVEVREGEPGIQLTGAVAGVHGRSLDVVEQALREVTRGNGVLEALLILDAHRVEAEVVRDAQRRDVHPELAEQLRVGQLGCLLGAGVECHPRPVEPVTHPLRLVRADGGHLGDQGALGQPFLVDTDRVEDLVVEDGVVHAHAALVEDPDDRLVALELGGERAAQLDLRAVRQGGEVVDVAQVVVQLSGLEPGAQPVPGPRVGEVLAPQDRVAYAGLGQARREVEQPDETGELAAPVGHEQDRPGVGAQSCQDVVAVLPHGLDDDQGRVAREGLEHLDARPLAVDETVTLVVVHRMTPTHAPAQGGDGRRQVGLKLLLGRPARHVGAQTQVTAGHRVERVGLRDDRRGQRGQDVGAQEGSPSVADEG